MGIPVLVIPSLRDVETGKAKINDLRAVNINDLIERRYFQKENKELHKFINNKVICVTGAGGSIGSNYVFKYCLINLKKLFCSREAK